MAKNGKKVGRQPSWFAVRAKGTTSKQNVSRRRVLMSRLEQLRAEAAERKASADAVGTPIQHCAALEQVAKRHGFESWRACRAVLNDAEAAIDELLLRRYHSKRWNFSIDIPQRWNAFPTVPTNSPYEVIRFASREQGSHLLIIFREPRDPEMTSDGHLMQMQEHLQKSGFGNFFAGETAIGASRARTLDFNKGMDTGLWSCRSYVLAAETLRYVLGFGTNRWEAMLPVFERIAMTFCFEALPWGQAD
jgi:hypothetical protein